MEVADQIATYEGRTADFFVGEWFVQPRLGVASRNGQTQHLEPKTMQVLSCLAAHAGEVVLKDELIASVWRATYVSEHVLTHAIWQLRHIFGECEFIQTIPRRGYRLMKPVRVSEQRIRSIAVLPLANLSAEAGQEYFADGMTEALISALAQISGLRVISRTSVMQYKNANKLLPQIAAELGVDGVIEGSVVREAGRVGVTIQVIRATTDQRLWAKTYTSDLRGILDLQQEMARGIAAEIQVSLTADEHTRLRRSRPVDPAAHEAYLKGRYCYFRMTEVGLRASMQHMREAIAADAEYALGYTGLASAAAVLSRMSSMPPLEAERIIRPAVARALELDPSLSEAHCVLGGLRLYYDWDWVGAEQALKYAIALNSSSSMAYGALAELYEALDRAPDAIAAWRQACQLDPLSLFFPALLGGSLILAGQPGAAAEQLQKTIRLEPNYWLPYEILSFALVDLKQWQEATRAAETAVRLAPDAIPKAALGYVYGLTRRESDTRNVLADLQRLKVDRHVSPLVTAALLTVLGEFDRALDFLEEGFRIHDPVVVLIRTFPFWRPLRGHPRFQELVRRMNFPVGA